MALELVVARRQKVFSGRPLISCALSWQAQERTFAKCKCWELQGDRDQEIAQSENQVFSWKKLF